MILKNKNSSPPGGFVFYYTHPETGKTVRVPSDKTANGVSQLASLVKAAFRNNKIPVPPNLEEIVEHQICIRQPEPLSICYNGGIGDMIHHQLAKPVLNAIALKAGKVKMGEGIARIARKVAGCGGCGGTRTYASGKNNLGRAGKLNSIAGKFALNAEKR
jgi:hypothetical protein